MGRSRSTRIISVWLGAALVSVTGLLGVSRSNAQTLYNITFSQFSPGTVYTNAAGAPADFSSYVPGGSNPLGVSSYIFPVFTVNLTNQPLVCNNAGLGVGNFLMQMGDVSSNAVTLDMQLALDSSVGAAVTFGQSGPPGSNVTSIVLTFPESATGTMQVQSVDGPTNSPTVLYSFQTNLVRTDLQKISFTLNLPASTFSLIVNGVSLASHAPIGSQQPINLATISIGDIENLGIGGNGGMDNIVLGAPLKPNILGISFDGPNVMVGLNTSYTLQYDLQTTTDLTSDAWSTISSNIHGAGGLTNFICGSIAGPQQFYRVGAHP